MSSRHSPPSAVSAARSRRRPRWMRERTVPMGTPSEAAISSYERSMTSRARPAARNSSGSDGARAGPRRRARGRLVGGGRGREHPVGVVGQRVHRRRRFASHLVEEHVRHDPGQPALQRSGLVALQALADPKRPPARDPVRRRRCRPAGRPRCRGSARGHGRPLPTWEHRRPWTRTREAAPSSRDRGLGLQPGRAGRV